MEHRPDDGVYLTLDWLRVAGPAGYVDTARAYLEAKFGGPPVDRKGQYFCEKGLEFPGGVKLLFDHPSDICIVDFTGKALSSLDAGERVQLLRDLLAIGFHTTRIDLAADFVGQGLNLYGNALDSCYAGELVGARVFNPVESRTHREIKGRTLYLGLRGGNGSGRYVRVYDKGLETQTADVGEWERFEVEFTDQPARKAGAMFAEGVLTWTDIHKALMLGAVEFRVNNGQAHRSRRPLVEWWAEMVKAVECVRHSTSRPPVEFNRHRKWLNKCVFPTLQGYAKSVKMPIATVMLALCTDIDNIKTEDPGSLIEQFHTWWDRFDVPPKFVPEHWTVLRPDAVDNSNPI